MVQVVRKLSFMVLAATLVFGLGACKSKKTSEDTAAPVETADDGKAPQIESTPMSFDASGSDSGKIEGLQSINFEYDRASLSAEAKRKIQGNVDWMKKNTSAKLQVEGHADSRGSIEYNLSLGERRAQAVKAYMSSLGIPGGRLSIISYGKEKPLSNGDSESDHQKNR
ncbi:MAG: OmpA family protein, partial [Pseudobdellovibrionaceae bacterium]